MTNWIGYLERTAPGKKLPLDNLKRCPLCGVLNAVQNGECFVCRWHGEFDRDPVRLHECLVELMERCPELADALSEVPPPKPSAWTRLKHWFAGLFRSRLDITA
jgi:hypothetical protein